jgi:hypothetical protein
MLRVAGFSALSRPVGTGTCVRMRSLDERRQVEKLLARGASDYAIAALTGVPRSTVGHWRRHPDRGPRERAPREEWRPPDPRAYAYLLGLYLGDGCLGAAGSPLMIALDARYPGIITAAEAAIEASLPGIAVHRYRPIENLVRVVASSPLWRHAFPQHGAGRKHTRPIELVDWQLEITHAFPKELLRGLIHSDGCRTTNRFKSSCRAAGSANTSIPATSSRTCPRTSGGSSATTVSCWAFGGRSRTRGTSRFRIGSRSRYSTSSSVRSGDRYTGCGEWAFD